MQIELFGWGHLHSSLPENSHYIYILVLKKTNPIQFADWSYWSDWLIKYPLEQSTAGTYSWMTAGSEYLVPQTDKYPYFSNCRDFRKTRWNINAPSTLALHLDLNFSASFFCNGCNFIFLLALWNPVKFCKKALMFYNVSSFNFAVCLCA